MKTTTKRLDLDCGATAIITGNRHSADVTIYIQRGNESVEKTWTRENDDGAWCLQDDAIKWLSDLGLGSLRSGGWIARAAERIGE